MFLVSSVSLSVASEGGGGLPRAALARGGKRAKYTHANSDCINLFAYEEQKNTIANTSRSASYNRRQPN